MGGQPRRARGKRATSGHACLCHVVCGGVEREPNEAMEEMVRSIRVSGARRAQCTIQRRQPPYENSAAVTQGCGGL